MPEDVIAAINLSPSAALVSLPKLMSKGIKLGKKCEVLVDAVTVLSPVSIKQSLSLNRVTTRTLAVICEDRALLSLILTLCHPLGRKPSTGIGALASSLGCLLIFVPYLYIAKRFMYCSLVAL